MSFTFKRNEPLTRIADPLQISLMDSSMDYTNQLSFPEISNIIFASDALIAKYDPDILLGHNMNSCNEQPLIHQNQQLIIMASSTQANLNASAYAVTPLIEQFGHEHISSDLNGIDIESFVTSLPEIDDFNMQICDSGSSSNQNLEHSNIDPSSNGIISAKSVYSTFNFETSENNKNQYSIMQLCNTEIDEKSVANPIDFSVEQIKETEKLNLDAAKNKIEFISNVDALNHVIMSRTLVNNRFHEQTNNKIDSNVQSSNSLIEKALNVRENKAIKKSNFKLI
jgi:hypothetical protein